MQVAGFNQFSSIIQAICKSTTSLVQPNFFDNFILYVARYRSAFQTVTPVLSFYDMPMCVLPLNTSLKEGVHHFGDYKWIHNSML